MHAEIGCTYSLTDTSSLNSLNAIAGRKRQWYLPKHPLNTHLMDDIRAKIEKIVCDEFKEGESFAYVSYDNDDLSAVTIDGNFDLKELIINLETLFKELTTP